MATLYVVIGEKRYEFTEIWARPTLNDLVAVKYATGLGMETIRSRWVDILDGAEGARVITTSVVEDTDALEAIRALIWLVRHRERPGMTVEEACDFPLDQFGFAIEDDDEPTGDDGDTDPPGGEAANPTSDQTDSVLVDGPGRPAGKRKRTNR